jgi:chromosome segregation ATPase
LRNGPELQGLENKRKELEAEITGLQTQIVNVGNWPDREQLNNLILEEDRLTLTLTKLQSRLTALKQDRSNPEYDVAEQLKKDGPQRVAALEISVQNLRNELDALQNEISGEEAKLGTRNSEIAELDNLLTERTTQFNALKAEQTNSTSDLAGAQIEKSKLVPLLQSLEGQETVLNANAERLRQQTEATQSITDQLQASVAQKTEQVSSLDKQIESDSIAVGDLKARIDAANQSMALIRNKMATEFKPLSELKTVDTQIFALEDTIDGLDKEIDTLDMRVASAEGKLNRFTRACNREPACKAAIN